MVVAAVVDRGPASARPATESFADDGDENFSPVRGAPMFEEKNPLPRSKLHSSVGNRHCLAGAR